MDVASETKTVLFELFASKEIYRKELATKAPPELIVRLFPAPLPNPTYSEESETLPLVETVRLLLDEFLPTSNWLIFVTLDPWPVTIKELPPPELPKIIELGIPEITPPSVTLMLLFEPATFKEMVLQVGVEKFKSELVPVTVSELPFPDAPPMRDWAKFREPPLEMTKLLLGPPVPKNQVGLPVAPPSVISVPGPSMRSVLFDPAVPMLIVL
jgi:hypothetical protein